MPWLTVHLVQELNNGTVSTLPEEYETFWGKHTEEKHTLCFQTKLLFTIIDPGPSSFTNAEKRSTHIEVCTILSISDLFKFLRHNFLSDIDIC